MAEVAVAKRIKINKIQQQMMLAVLGASLILGVALVFSIFFIKYIKFNIQVIDEKDKSISNYYTTIKNVGICIPKNNDGKFSDADLKACDPNAIDVTSIPGTLRYNVMINMAENNSLESVARDSQRNCYGSDGKKIDFAKLYQQSESDEDRASHLSMLKLCSSLRVIPDALPASQNEAALLSSMNQIFIVTGVQPESLAPNSSGEVSPVAGIEVIPVAVSYEDTPLNTTRLLQNLEKSIRSFSFRTATITWKSDESDTGDTHLDKLELSAQALAFYTKQITASETTKTIYATKEAKKAGGTSGIKTIDDIVDEEMSKGKKK
jgi:hypothetical protein